VGLTAPLFAVGIIRVGRSHTTFGIVRPLILHVLATTGMIGGLNPERQITMWGTKDALFICRWFTRSRLCKKHGNEQ
jgi:hypothetical protein